MKIKEALDDLYVCVTNAKSETLEEGYYEKCYYRVIDELEQKDKAESDLYEANNRINDLLDIVEQKDKIINEMADYIKDPYKSVYLPQIFKARMGKREAIKKYFEERCK